MPDLIGAYRHRTSNTNHVPCSSFRIKWWSGASAPECGGGRRWRWLSCEPKCVDLGPALGCMVVVLTGSMPPASVFAQTPHLATCPLASRPRHTEQAAGRRTNPKHDAKKVRMKETRLGEKCRGDNHAEGRGACPRPTKTKTTPARRRAPAALGCHDHPVTPNAHGVTPPWHRTSLVLWRLILVRDVSFEGAAWFFFCVALNKRPSLCGV